MTAEPKSRNPKDLAATHKATFHLIPVGFLIQIGQVLRNGALKYGAMNWRSEKVRATVYYDALQRHLQRWLSGEDIDRDSGRPHLAHVASNCAIIMDAREVGALIDDRPKGFDADRVEQLLEAIKQQNEEEDPSNGS